MLKIEADRGSAVVTRMIKDFANEASKYLMPRITFVGQDSKLAEDLQEDFSWLTLSTEFKANDSEIFILKNIPENFLEIESEIPENTAIIVVVDTTRPYQEKVRQALQKRIAVTLHSPELEKLMWTIRATLLLKEAAYPVDSGARLFSVDSDFRKMMSQCITSIVRGENIVISSESTDELEQVKDFLLTPMPYAIRPRELDRIEDIGSRRNNNKYLTIACVGDGIQAIFDHLSADKSDAVHGKKLIVFHRGFSKKLEPRCGMKIYKISSLEQRHADRNLHALMQIMERSHEAQDIPFKIEGDSSECGRAAVIKEIDAMLKLYKRMSLDALITETESTVLIELKKKAGSVKAVVAAAGISQPTYYKKISKYKKARSVLGINRNI